MKRLCVLVCLAAFVVFPQLRAHAQDDQYLRIYTLIQEGAGFENSGDRQSALDRYVEAQTGLQRFQRIYPDWNTRVVSYRLNFLASKIAELSARLPAPAAGPGPTLTNASTAAETAAPAVRDPSAEPGLSAEQAARTEQLEQQLSLLRGQLQELQGDNAVLEAKLKEALSAQPAAIDPREMARAEEQMRSLQKENELLKVTLEQRGGAAPAADAAALEQLRQELAEANRRLADQTETSRTLSLERQALQNTLQELIAAPSANEDVEAVRRALDEANRKLGEQTEAAVRVAREKDALQARLSAAAADADAAAALRAENQILKQQVAELKEAPTGGSAPGDRQLAQAQAQIAALQSEKEILRLERIALENRVKQLMSQTAGSPVLPSPGSEADAARIKQLEAERDELQGKLDTAQRELYGRNSRTAAARVEELSGQLEILRTRIGVLEAQRVPYSAEELALFKRPETPRSADPAAGRKPVTELPAGTAALVAEAQRDFAARRLDQAEEKYRQVLRQDQNNVYTLANLAAIQLERGEFGLAETNVQQALAVEPNDPYSVFVLGYLRFRQERYDDALDALGRAAKLDPRNPEVQNYLGLTLSQKGMRGPAETALRKAIQLEPGYASAHNNLAVIYLTQRPPLIELARWHYDKARAAGMPRNSELEVMLEQAAAGTGALPVP